MGLYFSLHVLLPSEGRLRASGQTDGESALRVRFWRAAALMAERVSWPVDRGELAHYGALDLANLCLYSWLYGQVCQVRASFRRTSLAPLIAIGEDVGRERVRERFYRAGPEGWCRTVLPPLADAERVTDVILPFWDSYWERGSVSAHDARSHNQYVRLPAAKAREDIPKTWQYNDTPFVWVPARRVAGWIRELERDGEHAAQQVLRQQARARAIVQARRAYLAGLGRAGARVLFNIGDLCDPKVPEFF